MFIYPALTIGFLFVAVPLLVHLINMLRHRRQRWAAMDFLLASYRKQKKWIVLRQLLLLLARLGVAAILIALLCGWTGGRQLLGALGGRTVHHVVILDDSYSMGDASGGSTAYARSLQALRDLTRRLAANDGNHQLTVLRASRAALAVRAGSDSGDAAAELSAQTVTSDARLINRVMATAASSIRADLVAAIDMAAELLGSTPADQRFLYIASDFRQRDWASPERVAESLRRVAATDAETRMIDCATDPAPNLAITRVAPKPDVWVAGVPVVVQVTVRNHGLRAAENVAVSSRVVRYADDVNVADPTRSVSGDVEPLPAMIIESLEAGAEITKSFQVYVTESGTHAIDVSLPEDALAIDNRRACTLPLTETERVLIVDENPDSQGAYHVASVLDPGSQVRIGAIPEVQPPSFLRSITSDALARYRAVYLIDLPEIGENAAVALAEYVDSGGGLCWFLGPKVDAEAYNRTLLARDRYLLPGPLDSVSQLGSGDAATGDVILGDNTPLMEPLRVAGDAALGLVRLSRSWTLRDPAAATGETSAADESVPADSPSPRVRKPLRRRDGLPLVTVHNVGRGQIITVLAGLQRDWTNWAGDPSFVVFLLQANASLWSRASPETRRFVDEPLVRQLPAENFTATVTLIPAAAEPPRVPLELSASAPPGDEGDGAVPRVEIVPAERAIETGSNLEEMLRPGIFEWMLTRADGSTTVTPVASVIRSGESELKRANPVEIRRGLEPVEVEFISSSVWADENQGAGSSTLLLVMLGCLAALLGVEQLLGYWASYHVSPNSGIGGKA